MQQVEKRCRTDGGRSRHAARVAWREWRVSRRCLKACLHVQAEASGGRRRGGGPRASSPLSARRRTAAPYCGASSNTLSSLAALGTRPRQSRRFSRAGLTRGGPRLPARRRERLALRLAPRALEGAPLSLLISIRP